MPIVPRLRDAEVRVWAPGEKQQREPASPGVLGKGGLRLRPDVSQGPCPSAWPTGWFVQERAEQQPLHGNACEPERWSSRVFSKLPFTAVHSCPSRVPTTPPAPPCPGQQPSPPPFWGALGASVVVLALSVPVPFFLHFLYPRFGEAASSLR